MKLVTKQFVITIIENNTPAVNFVIPLLIVDEKTHFNYTFPVDLFVDIDGDRLSYSLLPLTPKGRVYTIDAPPEDQPINAAEEDPLL